MEGGIDSIMDIGAPPAPAPRDAPPAPDGPGFDAHLDAALAERRGRADSSADRPARASKADAASAPKAKHDAPDKAPDNDGAPQQNTATPAPTPAPACNDVGPLALQIITADAAGDANGAEEPADDAPAATDAEANAAAAAPAAPPPAASIEAKPHVAKSRDASAGKSANAAPEADPKSASAEAPKPGDGGKHATPVPANEPAPNPAAPSAESQHTSAPTPHQAENPQLPAVAASADAAPKPSDPGKTSEATSRGTAIKPASREGAAAAPIAEQSADARRESRAADDAPALSPKSAGSQPTPTAPPRDTFTALLAQQDNAAPPAQSAATPAPTPASTTNAAPASAHAAAAAPAAAQVSREIIRKFDGATTRFELRLDPPELGRVDVKLDVSRDHRVTAVVAADSPQALSELTRHAREIEQALQSAGLELSDEGLSFDLSQHRQNLADGGDERANGHAGAGAAAPSDAAPTRARALTLDAWRGARVDLVA